jgi:nucleotide-binding universal stress UspA family protein
MRDTLPSLPGRGVPPAALAHADIGSGEAQETAARAAWLAANLPPLLRAGAIVLSDQPLATRELAELDPPRGTARARYYTYRKRQ